MFAAKDSDIMNMTFNFLSIKATRLVLLLALVQMIFTGNLPAQDFQKSNILGKDTASVNKVLKKAWQLREAFIDSSGLFYQQALNMAVTAGYRNGIGEAFCGLGRYHNIKNQQKTAIRYIRQATGYFENNEKGRELTVSANLLLSESYYYLGNYDSCAFYRYEALNYIQHNEIGNLALQLSVYSKILQFWLNAHEDIRHDKNIQQIMRHIDEMEKQAIASKDSNLLVNIYFQKAGYYHNISQNDSSRYYGLKNIELGRRLKVVPSMIMATYLNIATTYIDDKLPEQAIINIKKAVAEAPDQGKAINRYLIFADIFLGEAYNMQGQYQKAIDLVVPAFAEATRLNIVSIFEHAHKTLADAYDGTGQYKNAAEQRKLYSTAKDSLMKAEKMELSYNLEMKYRIAEKNKELAQKELSIVKNETRIKDKNILIVCITAGLILIIIIGLLILRNIKHKQKLQSEKITGLQQEMEIKLLKAMVSGSEKERSRIARDLHDGISGTIGSIRARVGMVSRKHKTTDVSKDFSEIMHLLEEASAEIRKTAHNLMPEILLQEGLVHATELFCERVAKGQSTIISFASYGEVKYLPPDLELSLYRTVQELVHNILKHANAAHATVQFVFNETRIGLTIEDDGIGMDNSSKQNYGVGLKAISERIYSLGGSIDIAGAPGEGTSIYIELDTAKIKHTKHEHQTYDHR
ncbi:MAG: sensor histidine kinase [Ferruginibacter sp.]